MQKNVGTRDAYLRIVTGLTLFGLVIAGREGRSSPVLMVMGAMKVAEGITRWCPMLHALDISTVERADAPQETLRTPEQAEERAAATGDGRSEPALQTR